MKLKKSFILLLMILSACKEKENPYIPTPDLLQRDFTQVIPKNFEIETELLEILNTDTSFCDNSFQNKKIELNGDNENILVNEVERFSASAYLSVYLQKIKKKPDIYVLKSRCCPMGPCYTSYFFQKQSSGKWKLFDTIQGEVIDYKKTKDFTSIKIQDESLTGLTFLGFWKDNEFEPKLVYRSMYVEIPNEFREVKIKTIQSKELNILKKPKDYHIDNLAFRLTISDEVNVYILQEVDNHYFVFVKATNSQIQNVMENFQGEREYLVSQIQGLPKNYTKSKNLEKLLEKTFYNIGWIEKF